MKSPGSFGSNPPPATRARFACLRGLSKAPYVYPIGVQAGLLVLVLVPLIYMRNRERPRRKLNIWVCDMMRIGAAYSGSEIILLILRLCGLRIDPWETLRPDQAVIHKAPSDVRGRDWHNGLGNRWAGSRFRDFRAYSRFVGHAVLISRLLEMVPGLILLYFGYKGLLRLGHGIVSDGPRSQLLNRLLNNRSPVDKRNGLGFQSGNYGCPIRKPWVAVQSALLCVCILVVRLAIYLVFLVNPDLLVDASKYISGVTDGSWKPMRTCSLRLIIPYVVFSLQFICLDYLLKYRPDPKGDPAVVFGSEWLDDDIQLEEIRLEVPVDEEMMQADAAQHLHQEQQHLHRGLPLTQLSSRAGNAGPAPVSTHDSVDDDLYNEESPASPAPEVPPMDTTISLRYGLVTAGLLNAASVGQTVRSRPFMFSPPSPLPVQCEEVDVGVGIDEGLPSYDDSQRLQQELLRDPARAFQRDALISELKRN